MPVTDLNLQEKFQMTHLPAATKIKICDILKYCRT